MVDPLAVLGLLFVMLIILAALYFMLPTTTANELIAETKKESKSGTSTEGTPAERSTQHTPEKNVDRYESLYNNFNKYVNQNLNQDRIIYFTTILIILAGLFVILVGVVSLLGNNNIEVNEGNNPNWIVIIAGVITEFIAATILIIYRTVNRQTLTYFRILEEYVRLEGAFRIIEDFDDDPHEDVDIKIKTKAELAKMLIGYSTQSTIAANENAETQK